MFHVIDIDPPGEALQGEFSFTIHRPKVGGRYEVIYTGLDIGCDRPVVCLAKGRFHVWCARMRGAWFRRVYLLVEAEPPIAAGKDRQDFLSAHVLSVKRSSRVFGAPIVDAMRQEIRRIEWMRAAKAAALQVQEDIEDIL